MSYKKAFMELMVQSNVLTFGEFTLKSGRVAPYFVNTGNYKTGMQAAKLGEFYADCIMEHGLQHVDTLFGPAYKGIQAPPWRRPCPCSKPWPRWKSQAW